MSFSVTAEQRCAFQEDGIVKLPGVVDSRLLDELNSCFEWAVRHPGPTLIGDAEGDEFSFVDLGNPAGRAMYEKLIADSPFGRIAADLWQSEFVGFVSEEVFWKKGKADQTFWHQDTPYAPWRGEHWANFWIPLCDHPADYELNSHAALWRIRQLFLDMAGPANHVRFVSRLIDGYFFSGIRYRRP